MQNTINQLTQENQNIKDEIDIKQKELNEFLEEQRRKELERLKKLNENTLLYPTKRKIKKKEKRKGKKIINNKDNIYSINIEISRKGLINKKIQKANRKKLRVNKNKERKPKEINI